MTAYGCLRGGEGNFPDQVDFLILMTFFDTLGIIAAQPTSLVKSRGLGLVTLFDGEHGPVDA